ncbi:hypothetical protein ACIGXM_06020 [Kitasatospora sp. NPDC052896]|uniref:hypothetical protein n=1 Tax=Kitasatospora sp. NPDC052896 TaxID=3364061 RepID=UPI0037C7C57D
MKSTLGKTLLIAVGALVIAGVAAPASAQVVVGGGKEGVATANPPVVAGAEQGFAATDHTFAGGAKQGWATSTATGGGEAGLIHLG